MSRIAALVGQTLRATEEHAEAQASHAIRQLIGYAAVGFAAATACAFGSVALYLALAPSIGAVAAAALIAFGWLVIGVGLLAIILTSRDRQRPPPILPSRQMVLSALERDAREVSPFLAIAAGAVTGAVAGLRRPKD